MSLENSVLKIGEDILKKMEGQSKSSIFNKDWWYGSIMDWSMKNESFKTQMFRFVDVLPSLNSNTEVARHLKEYFAESGEELPSVFNVGLGLGSLAPSLMAGAIRKNVTQMAKMFIVGENPQDALAVLKKNRKNKICFTVDILGEATLSEQEASEYHTKYIELIEWLSRDSAQWETDAQIDTDHLGEIPKVNVSVKLSALYSQINTSAWEKTKEILKDRLRPVFRTAMTQKIFLNLDMEQYSIKDLTLETFLELVCEEEFKSYPHFGCVIQAYLRDSLSDIQRVIDTAKNRKSPITVRLVKGAYWDYETIDAEQRNWQIPVYTNKQESDANYEDCTDKLLENSKNVKAAFGSHNVRSIAYAMAKAESLGLPKNSFEIQMLFGMADPIKKSLVDMGYRLREYAPVGELIPGMAYLVRRLLENTSNESWLRGKFAEGKSTDKLLANPKNNLQKTSADLPKTNKFYNEAFFDFALTSHRDNLKKALNNLKSQLPLNVPIVINGKSLNGTKTLTRSNPSVEQQTVSTVQLASIEQAESAIQSAKSAFKTFRHTPVETRAQILEKTAQFMNQDRYMLIAKQVLEVGKPWSEADGDVTEAIDFLNYYAAEMRKLDRPLKVGNVSGENSVYHYQAKGPTVVIAPWNFPLAILTGMVGAALVAGNTVVMKPAEQSSAVAMDLIHYLLKAGLPADCAHFLPGIGEEVGEYLVQHPDICTIAFTGSKNVGLHILDVCSKIKPGQKHVKRAIIEMGGKNAIIIDNDADLDEAIDGVVYSAFGFSGQKCSACSRVIVLEEVYEKFERRLIEAVKSIDYGNVEDPKNYFGPVVDSEACHRMHQQISDFAKTNNLLYQGPKIAGGNFVPPTIFNIVKATDPIAQTEIFGPILAILKAKDMDQAIEIANGTEYALTGGLYSRSPANIKKVREQLEVGNLYINRGITGAMVDRHPFGGFKMSGVGSKTGGPDYLKQFLEPRAICENTLRRGFAANEDVQS